MRRSVIAGALASALAFALAGCASSGGTGSDGPSQGFIQPVDGKYPVLTATGYSLISQQPGKTRDQKILEAMRASKLDAYRELTEQVYGIQIDSYTTLRDYIQQDEQLDASVSGLLKGARVIRTYPVSGNIYATEMMLDTRQLYQMYQLRGAL